MDWLALFGGVIGLLLIAYIGRLAQEIWFGVRRVEERMDRVDKLLERRMVEDASARFGARAEAGPGMEVVRALRADAGAR